jgi:hypothetical protein
MRPWRSRPHRHGGHVSGPHEPDGLGQWRSSADDDDIGGGDALDGYAAQPEMEPAG